MIFRAGDKVITWTGLKGTIISYKDNKYRVVADDCITTQLCNENELELNKGYYKTLSKKRDRYRRRTKDERR